MNTNGNGNEEMRRKARARKAPKPGGAAPYSVILAGQPGRKAGDVA
jgi:hypothetical protein